jgi:hypothetical protein
MSILVFAEATPNNAINADSEKRRAFVAPLFTAGYGERYGSHYRRPTFPLTLPSPDVMPTQAGIQLFWIPAFAGMTMRPRVNCGIRAQ